MSVTTSFERVRAGEVVTPLVSLPPPIAPDGPYEGMHLTTQAGVDHTDLVIKYGDSVGTKRLVVHGPNVNPTNPTNPAVGIPGFASTVGLDPEGLVAYNSDNNLVPMSFDTLGSTLSAIPTNQVVNCLFYRATNPGAVLIINDDHILDTSYTCVGQRILIELSGSTVYDEQQLAILTPLNGVCSYIVTVTATAIQLDTNNLVVQSDSAIYSFGYSPFSGVSDVESHAGGGGIALKIVGAVDIGNTPLYLYAEFTTVGDVSSTYRVIIGLKVDVTRASIPLSS